MELSPLARSVGLVVAVAFLGLIAFDAVLMLFWPAKWLRLPSYLGMQGSYFQKRRTGRNLEIRALGPIILTFLAYMATSILRRSAPPALALPVGPNAIIPVSEMIVCLGGGATGFHMLLNPKSWIEKHIQAPTAALPIRGSVPPWIIQVLSLLVILPAIYIGFDCISRITRHAY